MNRIKTLERLRSALPTVAPSMLKCDFGNLHREFELLNQAGVDVIHLDVMDGHFVPNLSYGAMVVQSMRPLTRALFDAHLMISHPERYLDSYLEAGCELITIHLEAVPDPRSLLSEIRERGAAAGLALNPGTPAEDVLPFAEFCDLVLVMSVEPGFGGQKFQPLALDKLRILRAELPEETILSVDGGIGPETIQPTAAAGASLFVAGSSIFDAADYGRAAGQMAQLARAASEFTSAES